MKNKQYENAIEQLYHAVRRLNKNVKHQDLTELTQAVEQLKQDETADQAPEKQPKTTNKRQAKETKEDSNH